MQLRGSIAGIRLLEERSARWSSWRRRCTRSASALTVVAPQPGERDYIHEKYFGELVRGQFLERTRDGSCA